MKKNARLQALGLLVKLLETRVPLTYLMNNAGELFPLAKELSFGVCRHYFRLEAIALSLLKKRPKEQEIWVALLLGLYQLHCMQKPEYAAVKETVDLLDKVKKPWAKGLLNAVLRTYCREQEQLQKKLQKNESFSYRHAPWFIKRIQVDWPNDWQAILEANNHPAPMSLRVNQQKISRADYLHLLETQGILAYPQQFSALGIVLDQACDVLSLPGFTNGQVSVQDQAAQLAITLLDLQPGLRVLDACCAPGGKTCHILEAQPLLAECVALDIEEKRLQRVQENLKRLNLNAKLVCGDGLTPYAWWDGKLFDRILLDAPCSATGVIRRHPDIKLLRTEEEINKITRTQQDLLEKLWPLLAPGGLLLYATCSILPQENDSQLATFLAKHADSEFIGGEKSWGRATKQGWQILPSQNMDGFFYSLIKKNKIIESSS